MAQVGVEPPAGHAPENDPERGHHAKYQPFRRTKEFAQAKANAIRALWNLLVSIKAGRKEIRNLRDKLYVSEKKNADHELGHAAIVAALNLDDNADIIAVVAEVRKLLGDREGRTKEEDENAQLRAENANLRAQFVIIEKEKNKLQLELHKQQGEMQKIQNNEKQLKEELAKQRGVQEEMSVANDERFAKLEQMIRLMQQPPVQESRME